MNKNLLTGLRTYYKPFDYPQAFDFFEKHEQMHWIPTEVQMHEDVRDYWHKLTEDQRFIIHNSLKLFTQSDHDVEDAYVDVYFKIFNNYPEIRMMLNSFSSREAIHQWAYSYLNDTLDLPDSIYQEFFKYKAMLDKHNYLTNAKIDFNLKETNPKEYLRQVIKYIIINTAFTEGMMLFSSFVLMLNITRMEAGGKMPGMGEIIRWSIRDEECFSDDTEVLTNNGFKLFKDLEPEDKVGQYNFELDIIQYDLPLDYIEKDSEGTMVYITDGVRINQLVTPLHDIVYKKTYADNHNYYTIEKIKAKEILTLKQTTSNRIDVDNLGIYVPYFENYQDGIINSLFYQSSKNIDISSISYEGKVYCVTMPLGNVVIKRNGTVSVSGNCHVEGVSWLFRTLIEENSEVWTDELKKELYEIARHMVSLEDAFIDLCYDGEIKRTYPGLSKEDLHTYIRWIADIRLNQFGLKKNWNVEKNPLPWVGDLSLPVNTSFFEEKGNAYSKGAVQIDNLDFE